MRIGEHLQRSVGNAATSRLLAPMRSGAGDPAAHLATGRATVQRMLVPILNPKWNPQQTATIVNRQAALAQREGQDLKQASDIASLKADEPLWLYSHGSAKSFGGKSAQTLVEWLIANGLPAGKRRITLKGCKTGPFAPRVEALLRSTNPPAYAEVEVVGYESTAYTTAAGVSQLKSTSRSDETKGRRGQALAEIKARREGATKQQAVEAGKEAYKGAVRFDAVFDEGSKLYIAGDPRAKRRFERGEKRDEQGSDDDADEPATKRARVEQQQQDPQPRPRRRKMVIDDSDSDDSGDSSG